MIKYWLYLDLIALILATFRNDWKNIYETLMLDFKMEFYIQGALFIIVALLYFPFTIPYTIIKLIKDYYGK